mmetsp:Transcript_31826/g.65006  ORF Transcript_31826/g.65006 Transcript_31826/m.65006 type:complete len:204 (-) Transcript_31826:198-809(-)
MMLPHQVKKCTLVTILYGVVINHSPGDINLTKKCARCTATTDASPISIEVDASAWRKENSFVPFLCRSLNAWPHFPLKDSINKSSSPFDILWPYQHRRIPLQLIKCLSNIPLCPLCPVVLGNIQEKVCDSSSTCAGDDISITNNSCDYWLDRFGEFMGKESRATKSNNIYIDIASVVQLHASNSSSCSTKGMANNRQIDLTFP